MREEDDQLYIYKLYGISVPRRIKAQKTLRQRIGPLAKITDQQIEKAQHLIDNPTVDFKPYIWEFLNKIEYAVDTPFDSHSMTDSMMLEAVLEPMSHIKGQAGMFGNPLVSEISRRVIMFLDLYPKLDADIIAILKIYCRIVKMSYETNLMDINVPGGRALSEEMEQAMNRYHRKVKKLSER